MLLYSRKKVRYRRDGYCWKKRKDGKTTREDHMKLKVQGTEVCHHITFPCPPHYHMFTNITDLVPHTKKHTHVPTIPSFHIIFHSDRNFSFTLHPPQFKITYAPIKNQKSDECHPRNHDGSTVLSIASIRSQFPNPAYLSHIAFHSL